MAQLTARSSTIFIATGRETRVYRSVDEVPPELRRQLVSCTHGINSATILIADKHGREELVRTLQGRPSDVECRLLDSLRPRRPEQQSSEPEKKSRLQSVRTILELLLPVAVGASLWFFIESHF